MIPSSRDNLTNRPAKPDRSHADQSELKPKRPAYNNAKRTDAGAQRSVTTVLASSAAPPRVPQGHENTREGRSEATSNHEGSRVHTSAPGQTSRLFDIRQDDEAREITQRQSKIKAKRHRKAVKLFSGSTFKELPICERLVKQMEEGMKMHKLTAPQQLASPLLLQNQDVMLKSPTGTGKTLAYALPVVNDLQGLQHKVARSC